MRVEERPPAVRPLAGWEPKIGAVGIPFPHGRDVGWAGDRTDSRIVHGSLAGDRQRAGIVPGRDNELYPPVLEPPLIRLPSGLSNSGKAAGAITAFPRWSRPGQGPGHLHRHKHAQPPRTTPPGLRGPSSCPEWGRSFLLRAQGAAGYPPAPATAGCGLSRSFRLALQAATPAAPAPKRAIELGSGTTPTVTGVLGVVW
jgi:hypothetical protein